MTRILTVFGFKKKECPVTHVSAPVPATETTKKACCAFGGMGTKQTGVLALTLVATFGPKRFRPHAQTFLAVIGVGEAVARLLKVRKGA